MDKYILKDIAKAFIDMEFPEFLRKKDVNNVMFDNRGCFECRIKRYLTGAGHFTMTFTYANTSFDYELSESNYTDDDGKHKHYVNVYGPYWMQRIHMDEGNYIERIMSIVLDDVKKQFDEYDISDRKR